MIKSVIISGSSSFVGLHLAEAFAGSGWHVVATHSRPVSSYDEIRTARLTRLAGRVELRALNVCDGPAVAGLIAEVKPKVWVQHAGYAENYGSPDYDLTAAAAVNVAPLVPLYAALAGMGCGIIVTGSSMEYSSSNVADREQDACFPDTPYGLSKLSETLAARQLALRYQVPTRIARLYIPFGDLDNPKKLLATVSRALHEGNSIDLSACEQQRDFVAVEDVAQGYLALAADLPRSLFDIFNLCSGRPLSLKSLLLAMAGAAGRPVELLRFGAVPMRSGEPEISFGDNGKAAALLRWVPRDPTKMIARLVSSAG